MTTLNDLLGPPPEDRRPTAADQVPDPAPAYEEPADTWLAVDAGVPPYVEDYTSQPEPETPPRRGYDLPGEDSSPAPTYDFLNPGNGSMSSLLDPSRQPPAPAPEVIPPDVAPQPAPTTPAHAYEDSAPAQASLQEVVRVKHDQPEAEVVEVVDDADMNEDYPSMTNDQVRDIYTLIGDEFPAAPEAYTGLSGLALLAFPPLGAFALSSSVRSQTLAYHKEVEAAEKASDRALNLSIGALILAFLLWAVVIIGGMYFRADIVDLLRWYL